MPNTQFTGLTKRPNIGLDYEALVAAQAAGLPKFYSQRDAQRAAEEELAIEQARIEAEKSYYAQMERAQDKANQLAKEQAALAQKSQYTSSGLGLVGAGLSAYGMYKNAGLLNAINKLSLPTAQQASLTATNADASAILANMGSVGSQGTQITPGVSSGIAEGISKGGGGVGFGLNQSIPALETGIEGGGVGAGMTATNIAQPVAELAATTGAAGTTAATTNAEITSQGLGAGAEATSGTTSGFSASSVAPVLAIIGAAEIAKNIWGQPEKDWDEKRTLGKLTSAPGFVGSSVLTANLIPGWQTDPWSDKIYKKLFGENNFLSKGTKFLATSEMTVMKPLDMLFGGRSWICSATDTVVGLSDIDKEELKKFKTYVKKNHHDVLYFYLKNGKHLIKAINEKLQDEGIIRRFYLNIKSMLIAPILEMIRQENYELAYQIYYMWCDMLFNIFIGNVTIDSDLSYLEGNKDGES